MAALPPETAMTSAPGERTIRRIVYLTPAFGIVFALCFALLRRWDWAEGLLIGAVLGWLNFRWLKKGIAAFTSAAASASPENKSGSAATYLTAMFRYALIGLAVYVSFRYLHVPLLSLACGLCTLAVAIIAASVWEIVQSMYMRS